MAASLKESVEKYFTGDSSDACKHISADINKNSERFADFIETLRDDLTSTDNVRRGRATQLVGEVLQYLPVSFLSADQIELVVTFLLSKLSDHHSVQPHALHSLAILTSHYPQLPSGVPEQICRTIFREVQNQTMSQVDRRATYTVLQNLLGSAQTAIEGMGGDFVLGFIQQMDTEKDPRNLMICFNCAQFICSRLPLGPFAEEMFEVLGCYFPVDFTPPQNDPYGITKADLVVALRRCLAASPEFGPFCIPLLLEKMTSDLQPARLDSYQTLTECAPTFGSQRLKEFLGSITSAVKREVLMNVSPDLVAAAKEAVRIVYTVVAPAGYTSSGSDDIVTSTLVDLYQDISKYLETRDIRKCCSSYSLLRTIGSASPITLSAVSSMVLSSLVKHSSQDWQISEWHSLLKELTQFVEVFLKFQEHESVSALFKPELPALFSLYQGLLARDDLQSCQLEAMEALTLLTSSVVFKSPDVDTQYLDFLVKKSVTPSDPLFRKQLLTSLNLLLRHNPSLVTAAIDSLTELVQNSHSALAAEALVHCVVGPDSFLRVNQFLLMLVSQRLTSESWADMLTGASAISQLLVRVTDHTQVVQETALPLLRIAVAASFHWTADTANKNEVLMTCFRDICRTIASSIDKNDMAKLWQILQKLCLEADSDCINFPGDFKHTAPLQVSSPWQQTRLVALLEGVLAGGDFQAMREQQDQVFEAVFKLGLESEDQFTHLSACRCLASMLNKAPIGSNIHWFLEPIIERLKTAMASQSSPGQQERAVTLWVWLTKAMECRAHSATGIFSSYLISALSEPGLGRVVSQRLGLVVQDVPDMFSPQLFYNFSPLYKQRFLTLNLPTLLDGYHQATCPEIRQNYLVALSQITSDLPIQVMRPHFNKLVPLLLQLLDQSESEVSSLSTLSCALTHAPEVVTPNLASLISRLLFLSRSNTSMKVRVAALKCLETVASLTSYSLLPHQSRVVKELTDSLGDKKRLVRKQAVETRSAWILLEQIK